MEIWRYSKKQQIHPQFPQELFDTSYGIVVDGDRNLVISDYNNHRIQIYDSCGVWKKSVGSGQFYHPIGIDLDPEGNWVIADQHNHRIQIITPNGESLSVFGGAALELSYPWGIFVDKNGLIVVVEQCTSFPTPFPTTLLSCFAFLASTSPL